LSEAALLKPVQPVLSPNGQSATACSLRSSLNERIYQTGVPFCAVKTEKQSKRLEKSIAGWAKPVHVHKSRLRLTNVPGNPRRSTGLWRASREDYHETCKLEK
jgi:hypothetical protein